MGNNQKRPYGGQAVMEGVMFGGKHTTVTAVRRNDRSIDYFEVPKKSNRRIAKLKKIPFLRGIIGILESMANGTKHLNFSTEHFDVDPKDDEKIVSDHSKLTLIFGVAAVGILSFFFAKFVFTILPALIAEAFRPIFPGHVSQNLLEGLFKISLLLSYIYFVSFAPVMKRVFQYHGAEHKVINAYENGLSLTTENVQKQSRLHYRCGSSFILFTAIIGIILYFFVPSDPLWLRLSWRVALIPVVLGIAFEVLQLTNKLRSIPVLRYLGYPGLWLQLLTTKKPDDEQVEVAIHSFNEMLEREKQYEASAVESRIV
jgi:uncharacterized protein YqhQ